MISFLISLSLPAFSLFQQPPEAPQVAAIHGQTFQKDLTPPELWSQWKQWNMRTGELENNALVWQTVPTTLLTLEPELNFLSFGCHGGKQISIDLRDGSIKLDGVKPDEAALAFWTAVTTAYPYVREMIRHSKDGEPWSNSP